MIHTIAASAFAPFLRDIGTQPHVISLTSGKGAGKTLTLQLAAAIWGDPTGDQTDLYDNWNTTAKGLPSILGSLRMLPAFRDEAGMAGLTAQEWGVLLYTLTQGASRTRGNRDGGAGRTPSWRGILFATGNGELLAGAEGGAFDGLDRRIIDFAYPAFTASREHAKRLYNEGRGLLVDCYGHLGQMLLEQYTVTRVRELLDRRRPPPLGPGGQDRERGPRPDADPRGRRDDARRAARHRRPADRQNRQARRVLPGRPAGCDRRGPADRGAAGKPGQRPQLLADPGPVPGAEPPLR